MKRVETDRKFQVRFNLMHDWIDEWVNECDGGIGGITFSSPEDCTESRNER